mmetsp:Transcript_27983/g.76942  ORF Transcript_27983/g.76942 Transcript_27983/m.76942 type:complete len:307 (+) Transcript_27983:548-1468(+)
MQTPTKAKRVTTQPGSLLLRPACGTAAERPAPTLPPSPAPVLALLLAPPCALARALCTHWLRISEAGKSCNGKVSTTAAVTRRLEASSTTCSMPEVRVAKKAMTDAVSNSPRKAMPQVMLMLRKANTRQPDASTKTFEKAAGSLISFCTGSTSPRPSKAKKTQEASITVSATGLLGQARARTSPVLRLTSALAPDTAPETTATVMATLPSLFRKPSCATKRSKAMAPNRGSSSSITASRLRKPWTCSKFPETRSTKQQQTPVCTMNTKTFAALRPQGPRAQSATSPRFETPGRAKARLHLARISMT